MLRKIERHGSLPMAGDRRDDRAGSQADQNVTLPSS
jgi:hypothetical protein